MKKKVLMIVYGFYPFDTRVRREAETLARDGRFEVSVLALKKDNLPDTYKMDGVCVKELNLRKYRGKGGLNYILSYFRFLWLSSLACSKAFFLREIDIVHVHNMPNFLVFSAILPLLFGKKVILDIHDSVPETFLSKFQSHSKVLFRLFCLEERISCAFSHKIVCVNHLQRETLVDRGISRQKTLISMNVPDHRRFDSTKPTNCEANEEDRFKMVYHGTVTKRLGIDLAIRAVQFLQDKITGFEYHIWGDGELLSYCIELSAKLGVSNSIFFNKPVSSDALPAILRGMALGIVANRRDLATELMLPVKMLEYIALGIPVVAPRLRCIEYYFSDSMVSYFEPENIDSMANAILRVYQDKSLRKTQAEKAKAFLDQYGWEKHQMDLINLYRNL